MPCINIARFRISETRRFGVSRLAAVYIYVHHAGTFRRLRMVSLQVKKVGWIHMTEVWRLSPQRGTGQNLWSGAMTPEAITFHLLDAQRQQQICLILLILRVKLQTDPNFSRRNSSDLRQTQEQPLAEVGRTRPPRSIPWRRP